MRCTRRTGAAPSSSSLSSATCPVPTGTRSCPHRQLVSQPPSQQLPSVAISSLQIVACPHTPLSSFQKRPTDNTFLVTTPFLVLQGDADGQLLFGNVGDVSLSQCKQSCVSRADCAFMTWYENDSCRTYSACTDPVNDITSVVKHTYSYGAARRQTHPPHPPHLS